MVALPSELKPVEGEALAVTLHDAELTVRKLHRYSPEQLIAEQKQILDQLEEDRAWLDAPRVGRELIEAWTDPRCSAGSDPGPGAARYPACDRDLQRCLQSN